MAQAVVRFLSQQRTARDGREQPLFGGVFGIFGHGNVAGIGQALQRASRTSLPLLPRAQRAGDGPHRGGLREDAQPAADARVHDARSGPGATNMITGAAGATINRVPVLLLPGDIFAGRASGAGAAAARVEPVAGRVGQRLLQAGVALLGSDQPARADRHRAARSDARADVAGRDRRGDAGAAAGRAGRGVRLSRRRCSSRASGRSPRPRADRDRMQEAARADSRAAASR